MASPQKQASSPQEDNKIPWHMACTRQSPAAEGVDVLLQHPASTLWDNYVLKGQVAGHHSAASKQRRQVNGRLEN